MIPPSQALLVSAWSLNSEGGLRDAYAAEKAVSALASTSASPAGYSGNCLGAARPSSITASSVEQLSPISHFVGSGVEQLSTPLSRP